MSCVSAGIWGASAWGVLLVAIGGCADGSESPASDPDRERAAFWHFEEGAPPVAASSRGFELLLDTGGCVVDGEPLATRELERIDVTESADRVEVTVWITYSDNPRLPQGNDDVCAGIGMHETARVELSQPLGDRAIADGFCSIEPSERINVGPLKCADDIDAVVQPGT